LSRKPSPKNTNTNPHPRWTLPYQKQVRRQLIGSFGRLCGVIIMMISMMLCSSKAAVRGGEGEERQGRGRDENSSISSGEILMDVKEHHRF